MWNTTRLKQMVREAKPQVLHLLQETDYYANEE